MPGDDIQLLPVALPAALTVGVVEAINLPENAEVAAVTVDLVTAPAGSNAAFDVLDNGTSVFAGQIGTLRVPQTAQSSAGGAVAAGDTALILTPSAAGFQPEKDQVLTIGTEDIHVTDVSGSPLTTGAAPEYQITVARAFNGTAAAGYAGGTAVLPAKPKVVAGATKSAGRYVPSPPASRNVPPQSAGDVLSVSVTAVGSGTAGGGGSVSLETVQR